MSVAPDLLLKSAPPTKPRAAAAKAPEKAAEPSRNEASSFSQVYAKERQAKAAERSDAPARPARENQPKAQEEENPEAATAIGQPELADSGKALPSEPASEEVVLDPLLLLGISAEPVEMDETVELPAETEPEPLLISTGSLTSSGPASMTEASFDPQIDALNQLPAVRMALEMGAKENAKVDHATLHAQMNPAAQNAAQNPGQSMLANRLLEEMQPVDETLPESLELQLESLSAKGLEALKESSAQTPPENFVSKLNALSQAIGQQQSVSARTPVIPGQPVPMQQGGWSEAVVDRVMLMSSQNLRSAEIQLDPAELGRLEVRISVNQEQTQVTFASPNAGVREALDAQMHRLREMFAQQGMNLLDVNVSDQSLNRGWQGQEGDGNGRGGSGREGLAADEELLQNPMDTRGGTPIAARGLVDYYA
ncbi:flagellar hook-length control protein FliK [Pseudomonas sp.]|uniref:flagellar hook-length control protein FliK n=1 Tax=Pseudomonas sp. TaxID=306 RepID=UPI002CC111EE|nr:flagellar hook-length control protein FliK [Pseudomonas sp.]HUE94330.1 flagellar hook-length control protein FliK [Pseudomonas sp.]